MVKIILSIAGGGIKGKIAAKLVDLIEQEMNQDVTEIFDLFVGTSIGSILCGAYASGLYSAKFVNEQLFVKENYTKMMSPDSHLNTIFGTIGLLPKYGSNGKIEILNKYFKENRMNTVEKYLMIPAYNVSKDKPKFFKSWSSHEDLLLSSIINASSAAPGYFSPEQIGPDIYADGGIGCNYPEDCAYTEGIRLWGIKEDIRILVLDLGKTNKNIQPKKWWGLAEWITAGDLSGLVFDGNREESGYVLKNLAESLGHKYLILDGQLKNNSLDDISDQNVENLEKTAQYLWEKHKPQIISLLKKSTSL